MRKIDFHIKTKPYIFRKLINQILRLSCARQYFSTQLSPPIALYNLRMMQDMMAGYRYFFPLFSTADHRPVIQSAFSVDFNGISRWPKRASCSKPIDRLIKKIVNRVSRRSWWTKNGERKCSGRNGHSRETIKRRRATITFIVRITYRYTSTIV